MKSQTLGTLIRIQRGKCWNKSPESRTAEHKNLTKVTFVKYLTSIPADKITHRPRTNYLKISLKLPVDPTFLMRNHYCRDEKSPIQVEIRTRSNINFNKHDHAQASVTFAIRSFSLLYGHVNVCHDFSLQYVAYRLIYNKMSPNRKTPGASEIKFVCERRNSSSLTGDKLHHKHDKQMQSGQN